MNETNEPRRVRSEEEIRRARAARRAKARKRKQMQQLAALIVLVLFLVVVVLLVGALVRGCTGAADETSAPSTEPPTTLPPETEPPTLPPVTWMTFGEDRALTAQQYFVYDVDADEFITISGDPGEVIYPASVTKLFTAYVAMQYLEPETVITATDALDLVAYGSSVAEIEYGDKLTAETLVEAMLLPSGNDAACILAVEAGRIIEDDSDLSAHNAAAIFVDEMNRQAAELGMTNTHFANPDGIHSDDHYTTFADLAILGKLSLENPTILKYARVAQDTVTLESSNQMQWHNTNATIDPTSEYYCPYAIGLKTGQTPRAGSCLLSAFRCNGRTLIIGVFGCPETDDRFPDTLQLFNEAMGFPYAESASVAGEAAE